MTRGLDTTSPRPSAWSADSSKSTSEFLPRMARPMRPAAFVTGRLTPSRPGNAGIATGKGCPVLWRLERALLTTVSLAAAEPESLPTPLLPFFWMLVLPKRVPRLRLKLEDLLLRFELFLFSRSDIRARGHQHHVAHLAHAEVLGLEDEVEGLVPRHVFEAQADRALDRIAHNDVEAGEIGNDLQRRAHLDVLEVEREFFTRVAEFLFFALLLRGLGDRLDLDRELAVGLIGKVLVIAGGRDRHAHVMTQREGVDGSDRGGEIRHVEAAL